jgi:hypothetical protein
MSDTRNTENRLKAAVDSVSVPPYLEARIRNRLRTEPSGRKWALRLVPVGVAAGLFVGLSIAYQLGHLRLTLSSQESYIAAVTSRIAGIMGIGLGDHIHCSVFRKFPLEAPKLESVVSRMGEEYRPLVPIVRTHVPENYKLMLAHQCRYHGRRFTHLSLVDGSKMVSLVIAQKREGEDFDASGLLPAFEEAGLPMYQSDVQRFALTAFETRDSLVYFISDLPQEENTRLLAAMTPELKEYFAQREL